MASQSPSIPLLDTETEQNIQAPRRTRRRWWLSGFGVGIALVFALTAIDFLIRGWRCLPFDFGMGLIVGPLWCGRVALSRCPVKASDLPRRRFQLRTGDMMLGIAYLGLWLGMVVTTAPLGTRANLYRQRAINAQSMADLYQKFADESTAEIKVRTDNIAKLRERKVPDGLLAIQRDFLRKLDTEGPPKLREERYRLISEGEALQLNHAIANEETFRTLVKHYSSLMIKYEAAMKRPWLEVAPDPDLPAVTGLPAIKPPNPTATPPPAGTKLPVAGK